MTTRKDKFLSKISNKTRKIIVSIINDIYRNDRKKYDHTSLKGEKNIFRIRKGKIRIIFFAKEGTTKIITVDFRGSAYK